MILTLSAITTVSEIRNTAPKNLSNYIIIVITNIYGNHLFLLFGLDTGNLFLVGNSFSTKLADNAFTQYTFLTG